MSDARVLRARASNVEKRKRDTTAGPKNVKRIPPPSQPAAPTSLEYTCTVDEQLAKLEGQPEPLTDPWPARALVFKCWRLSEHKDERDSL